MCAAARAKKFDWWMALISVLPRLAVWANLFERIPVSNLYRHTPGWHTSISQAPAQVMGGPLLERVMQLQSTQLGHFRGPVLLQPYLDGHPTGIYFHFGFWAVLFPGVVMVL